MARRKWSREQVLQMYKLYKEDSLKAVTTHFDVANGTFYTLLDREGLPRKNTPRLSIETITEICDAFQTWEGTIEEFRENYKLVSTSQIYRYLKRLQRSTIRKRVLKGETDVCQGVLDPDRIQCAACDKTPPCPPGREWDCERCTKRTSGECPCWLPRKKGG